MKKNNSRLLIAISFLLILPIGLTASGADTQIATPALNNSQTDSIIRNTRVFFLGGESLVPDDSVRARLASFYLDQFRNAQDPQVPDFMFMSKDASIALGIGVDLKFKGWYGWNQVIDDFDFSPYSISVPKNRAENRGLSATPAGTALFMTLLGHNSPLGHYKAYVQVNFNGYHHHDCTLKKAYVSMGNWTAGYATSTFSDPAAEPETIDGGGVNGKMGRTNMLVRYLHALKERWIVGGSLEFPSTAITTNQTTAECSQWLPDVVALGQYNWQDGAGHLRLAAMLRGLSYRDLLAQKNRTVAGWGVQLSAVVPTQSPLTLYGITSVGQGHESYSGDLSNGSYDLIPDSEKEGRLYAPTALSFIVGASYRFSPKFRSTLALSEMTYKPQHKVPGDDYKYGLYGAANLFWNITPRVQAGVEYVVGKRMNFNGEHATANRLDALFEFSF